mgnify:FL=1|tara:strand:- start:3706 stop:3933 length:228 start_codon:yes stop_codon:yes gene_type:complete
MILDILQAETVSELLKFETVAPVGLLLAFCALLIWHIKGLNDKIKEKDAFIEGISEKFFILAGKMEMLINQKSKD